jgi:hypothetical protein
MAQTVKLKRSAVAAKVPLTTDLSLGELAVNTNDGVLYTLMNDGTNKIVQLGGQAVSATATAGTNAQGQGALTSNLNVVTSTTANPSGVTLPTALLGKKVYIYNKGTNPINVYPATGAQIDSRGTNVSIQIPVDDWMEFNATSTTQWYSSAPAALISPTITSATLSGTLTAGGSAGTSGQILSSTGTGVQWINNTAVNTPTASNSVLDTISGGFNGSTTTFNLTLSSSAYTPVNAAQLTVVLGGVIQLPYTDYTVSGSTITFTTAPSSTLTCFIIANAGYANVSDGNKGDITVSGSGATWTINTSAITNNNISPTAAISGTKISPQFGAQAVTVVGSSCSISAREYAGGDGLAIGGGVYGSSGYSLILRPQILSGTISVYVPAISNAVLWTSESSGELTGLTRFKNLNGTEFYSVSSLQDGIVLTGNNSGTSSFRTTIQPASLTASRTITIPNVTGTIITTGDTGSVTSTMLAGSIDDTKLNTISTTDKVSLSALNVDGGTDIGSALADADLFIVDDGGAGTNRKAAATRISDYVFGKVSGDITISNTGTAAIASNVIVDGDVSATAAIAGTKISPNFGAQLIQSSQANQALSLTGTLNPAVTSNGLLSVGTLGFNGARMGGNFTSSQTSYYQVVLQNTSSNSGASCDFVVCNDASTDTATYGNFGINSSTFTGTGSLNLPSSTYVTATTGDLVLGTTTANQIRFLVNSGTTDAFGINTSGAWLVAGSAGTSGQTYRSGGSAAAPSWSNIGTSQVVSLTSTQQSTSTALANVTQLVATLEANATYTVDCFVTFQSAATTTGLNLGFTSPTGCNPMVEVVVPIVSTAAASALRIIFPNAAATTSGNVLGTGVTAINSNHTARLSGIIKNGGTSGNFQIQFATEVNASAVTLQIGSTMQLTRIA